MLAQKVDFLGLLKALSGFVFMLTRVMAGEVHYRAVTGYLSPLTMRQRDTESNERIIC
jgi:hypothetical protein